MKLFAIAALAATTFAGAASAMTSDAALAQIQFYAPNADVQSLTDAEIASLVNVIHSSDSVSEVYAAVRAALR
ncbi:hypothetical protein [Aestuariicoccus sp. MJ-SS9]|uniref:hypothetical protein n=1 Tax=Aestuariicoccus sp. MJ-SS9 TaxID=3079855 RepID=UPI0029102307|nr:hypothetical protein [Aestuariicoccus sp. MJ-SS9]MDU8914160.1 hypothetical protein [Aestuariicoccus sp. MJ-SS9]